MNLVGQKFGRLLVLERDNERNSKHAYWICQCDCGTIKSIRQDVLRDGTTQSCGCLAREEASKRIKAQGLPGANFINLSGQRFGRLTVLNVERKEQDGRRYSILYKCKCDCGNETIVYRENLSSLHTTSCGCKKDSYGVSETENILKELEIDFEKEKIFPDARTDKNGFLRMDFYLPEYNTVIEIDGIQHSYTNPTGYFTQEKLDRMKELDQMKNKYCEDRNIKIIRVPQSEWKKLNKEYILEKLN